MTYRLRVEGASLLTMTARLFRADGDAPVPASGPYLCAEDGGAAARLFAIGLRPEQEGGFIAEGDAAICAWTVGIESLPDSWELYVPMDLVATVPDVRPATMAGWRDLALGLFGSGVAAK